MIGIINYVFAIIVKNFKFKKMGQHTWFVKDREVYFQIQSLYDKLNKHDENIEYLDEMEILQIDFKIDELRKQNNTNFHDVFRVSLRNEDGSYFNKTFLSYKECYDFIMDSKNAVYICDLKTLKEFWDKYPNGLIYIG